MARAPTSLRKLRFLVLLSSFLLGIGISAPSMTVVPNYGNLSGIIKVFQPDLAQTQSFSILEGVWQLLVAESLGNIFVGSLLLLFSILFPLWKLGILSSSIGALSRSECPMRGLFLVEKLGKFSMIDIFVMALLVVAIKGLPGGTEVQINWGLAAFAASVLISMKIPQELTSHSLKSEPPQSDNEN